MAIDPATPPSTPPKMADVAALAGVSAMTVSRALKTGASVSAKTRARIMSAVDELGYVLDKRAGTLSSNRSGFVAALIPSINNSNFSDTARGITEVVEGTGLQLLLGYTDYLAGKEERLLESMLTRRPEGIILTGGQHSARARERLLASGIPVVETWDMPQAPIDHVVGFSNAAAMRALVEALHQKGYRSIGFIGGISQRDTRGAERRLGYQEAVDRLSLPTGRIVAVGHPPVSMEQGGEAIVRLLSRWPDIDAVVCVSDLPAFGALMECHRRGWAVPGRVAIAGFGDFEVGRYAFPRISTISVDAFEIGRAAGALLLRAIEANREKRRIPAEIKSMPFRILLREST